MQVEFAGEVFSWRGPAPYHFVAVPEDDSAAIEDTAAMVTYGWGMIPVAACIGDTEWTTSLWPKEGRYLLPLKAAVRRTEGIELGQVVDVRLTVRI